MMDLIGIPFEMHLAQNVSIKSIAIAYVFVKTQITLTMVYILVGMHLGSTMVYTSFGTHLDSTMVYTFFITHLTLLWIVFLLKWAWP
jgi:hypothetical protein